MTVEDGEELSNLEKLPEGWSWHLSTSMVEDIEVGSIISTRNKCIKTKAGFNMPIRLVGLPKSNIIENNISQSIYEIAKNKKEVSNLSLEQLGIMERRSCEMKIDILRKGKWKTKRGSCCL